LKYPGEFARSFAKSFVIAAVIGMVLTVGLSAAGISAPVALAISIAALLVGAIILGLGMYSTSNGVDPMTAAPLDAREQAGRYGDLLGGFAGGIVGGTAGGKLVRGLGIGAGAGGGTNIPDPELMIPEIEPAGPKLTGPETAAPEPPVLKPTGPEPVGSTSELPMSDGDGPGATVEPEGKPNGSAGETIPNDESTPYAPPRKPLEGRPHGGPEHDRAIDDYLEDLPDEAVDVRKDQAQVNAKGEKVSDNRPDAQWTDEDGVRHYYEVSSKTSRADPARLREYDPNAVIEVLDLEAGELTTYLPGDPIPKQVPNA
jgi:hypothetical protein